MASYVVSALKYRPQTFKSVVGQDALTTTLKNAIKSEKLAHAYLFCGPRGVGKTTCARIFAKTINCANRTTDGEACNECESCVSFNEQRSYSIHELDAASNNSVEDIRTLTDQVRIPPQIGKYSVYIIDEVHMLSQQAFNAFLKTLEEPPAHAIFILATTEKHKIIPTILSRCQIYDFNRISTKDIVNHLKFVAENEGIKIEESALTIIAQKSDGSMRDALSIFDQLVSFSGNNITYQSTIENLNVLDYEYYFRLVYAFLEGNVSQSLLIFNEVLNKGFDANHFITGLSSHLRDVLVCKDPVTIQLLEVGEDIAARYKQQATVCSAEFIFAALKISNEADLNYRISKNKRLLVELTLIRICSLIDDKKKALTEPENPPLKKLTPSPTTTSAISQTAQTAQTTQPAQPVITQAAQPVATQAATPQPVPTQSTETSTKSTETVSELTTTAPSEPQAEAVTKPTATDNPIKFTRPTSISITSLKKETYETVPKQDEVAERSSKVEPITQEDLQEKWNSYIATKSDDPGTTAFLKTHPPKLLPDNVIEITVDNKFQEKELQQLNLMSFLRKELNNSLLHLKIELTPETEVRKYLGPKELYIKMAEENPLLEKLRETLKMELD